MATSSILTMGRITLEPDSETLGPETTFEPTFMLSNLYHLNR